MQLRAYIYAMPEDIADVGSMAWDMGISRSSFQHMYKKNVWSERHDRRYKRTNGKSQSASCNDKSQRKGSG